MIWAQSATGIIGAAGSMPWSVPEDLRYFKEKTLGHPVVMGRRTWESFPPQFRPLPGRTSIVITRESDYRAEGALVVHSLEQALQAAQSAPGADLIWICGGGQIYREAMPYASLLKVTELDISAEGDTYAPQVPADFTRVESEPAQGWLHSRTGVPYRFLTYQRAV